MRVLLIEDDAEEALLIQNSIHRVESKMSMSRADSFQAGMDAISATRPQAVLLDLGLPDSQGMGTLREFRLRHPTMPVIVLTGLDDHESAQESVRLGAQAYMIKGKVSAAQIAGVIRGAVERAEIEAALDSQRDSGDKVHGKGTVSMARGNGSSTIRDAVGLVKAQRANKRRLLIVDCVHSAVVLKAAIDDAVPGEVAEGNVCLLDCTGSLSAQPTVGIYSVTSPALLETIGLRIEQILRLMGPTTTVYLNDLQNLARHTSPAAVAEFSHYLSNRLCFLGVDTMFRVPSGPHGDKIATTLGQVADHDSPHE